MEEERTEAQIEQMKRKTERDLKKIHTSFTDAEEVFATLNRQTKKQVENNLEEYEKNSAELSGDEGGSHQNLENEGV